MSNAPAIKAMLEQKQITVSYVPSEIKRKPEIADQYLLTRISELVESWDLDIAVLVAGDTGYNFEVTGSKLDERVR